jgi:hypothetical protein
MIIQAVLVGSIITSRYGFLETKYLLIYGANYLVTRFLSLLLYIFAGIISKWPVHRILGI